jgi:hypothetical protein
METLAFNPAQSGRQHPYMGAGYKGIGSQISQNYAQTLGILSAESYDDGRALQRSRDMRLKQMTAPDPLMQFGIAEAPPNEMRTDSDEMEKVPRRRKKHKIDSQNEDDEEEARKKARGRPRVDTKDETAADVSSTDALLYSPSLSCPDTACYSLMIVGKSRTYKKQFHIFIIFQTSRQVKISQDADMLCSGEGLKYGWLREHTVIVKKPLSILWKSRSKSFVGQTRR